MNKEDVVVGGFYKAIRGNNWEINGYHCFSVEDKLQFIGDSSKDKGLGNFQCALIKQAIYYADIESWSEEL